MAKGTKKLYYVKSRRGQGVVYTDKPRRREDLGVWAGKIEGIYCSLVDDMESRGLLKLPPLTYDDEPIELTLTLSYG